MGVDITAEGMDDVRDLIDKLELNAANERAIMNDVLTAAATPIYEDAKRTSQFIDRTGKLRKSIKIGKVVKKRVGYYTIKVYSETRYAHLVEYGHSGDYAAPHPFLEPAFIRHRAEAEQIIIDKLKEALK